MDKTDWKVAFWMMVIVVVVAIIVAASFSIDLASLQTDYDALSAEKKACGDGWYEQLELTATLMTMIEKSDPARIEFLEGQLESCNSEYIRERHDRKFYQNALNNVPAYCSLGLNQFVIDGLREELDLCHSQLSDMLNKFYSSEPCRPYHHTRGNWQNYVDGLREELELCRMDTP